MPVVPKDAASVLLLRDAPGGGIQVLMVRRSGSSDFAAGMHVFPGGGVEEHDCGERMAALCEGMGPGGAMDLVYDAPSQARALGILVAGIRETFEETGILLACDDSGGLVDCAGGRAARLETYRREMKEGRLTFAEMLEREGLKPAVDRLVYFAHWVTPEISPIRYDTRFFLAAAPPCQAALHDGVETTDHLWISPQEALERHGRGGFAMLPPTAFNLRALERFSTVGEALSSAVGKEIPCITPRVSFEGGGWKLVISHGTRDYLS